VSELGSLTGSCNKTVKCGGTPFSDDLTYSGDGLASETGDTVWNFSEFEVMNDFTDDCGFTRAGGSGDDTDVTVEGALDGVFLFLSECFGDKVSIFGEGLNSFNRIRAKEIINTFGDVSFNIPGIVKIETLKVFKNGKLFLKSVKMLRKIRKELTKERNWG